jgi:DNA processing protein
MDYALRYSIPRAVIYNENTDANNHKYDLNRQIIRNYGKDIIVIAKNNLPTSVKKILSSNPEIKHDQQYQPSLFNFTTLRV